MREPSQGRAIAAIIALRRERLRVVEQEVAELDEVVDLARDRERRAERLVKTQEDALARLDVSARARLVGKPISVNQLSARLSTARQIAEQLEQARSRWREAVAEREASEAARLAAQPKLRAAHFDLERWRTAETEAQAAHQRIVSLRDEIAVEDETAERFGTVGRAG